MLAALCLLLQGVLFQFRHAYASPLTVICTGMGMKMVTPDGPPAPSSVHDHDKCCSAVAGLPVEYEAPVLPMAAPAPAAHVSFSVLARAWLGPLSRGPPARA